MPLLTKEEWWIYAFFGVVIVGLASFIAFVAGLWPFFGPAIVGMLGLAVAQWYTQAMYDGGVDRTLARVHAYVTTCVAVPVALIHPSITIGLGVGVATGLIRSAIKVARVRLDLPDRR